MSAKAKAQLAGQTVGVIGGLATSGVVGRSMYSR